MEVMSATAIGTVRPGLRQHPLGAAAGPRGTGPPWLQLYSLLSIIIRDLP